MIYKKKRRPTAILCGLWVLWFFQGIPQSLGIKPIFDYSNNMRLVMLPADTKLGSVIYRLRASDADENYPLKFTFYDTGKGKNGQVSELVSVQSVDCSTMSICEADVVLINSLEENSEYVLSLEMKDSNGETTIVESILQATAAIGPFVGAPRILKVPEDTQPGSLIESFLIRENTEVYRGVHCHLEPELARVYFELHAGFKTNVKDQSKCNLKLIKKLDYEARSAFIIQIVAENAWVQESSDTRNVGVHEIIVEVQDVPDTPPYFLIAPPVTRLAETAVVGTNVVQVSAYDGDYAHPQRLRYGLDPTGLPYSNYFDIDSDLGIVKVRKSLQDIDIQPSMPVMLRIFVEELNEKGLSNGEMSEVDIAIVIDDVINHPPKFLQKNYVTSINENCPEGTTLTFPSGFDKVQDFDKGDNGKLELSIIGFSDTFEVSPSIINQEGQFVISVKNNKRLDYELLRQLNFKIMATELGVSQLSTTADVTVNLLDINDNKPQFSPKPTYEINIQENQEAGVLIGKVSAFDVDSNQNGDVRFQNLNGNDIVKETFQIDINTGELFLFTNDHLDREIHERFVMTVEAVDSGNPQLSSQATVIVNLLDENDNPPIFKRRKYQGFMNSDLSDFRNDLQVEAFDDDQKGTKNSEIRYEIIHGNYERKFFIDSLTGKISVQEPLTPKLLRNGRQTEGFNPKVQRIRSENIEPVISLTVRAYDLGIPSLDSEVLVHIFTEQTSSRTMKFIVYEDPSVVNKKQQKFSDLISSITGGSAEIQDIQPYPFDGSSNIDRVDFYEVDYYDNRNPKTYEDSERSRRSVVDVVITYPTNSVVDMNDITSKLVREQNGNSTENLVITNADLEKLEYKNAALFWGLMIVISLIILTILIIICCYCCPCCPSYKKDKTIRRNSTSPSDLRILNVRNGNGEDVKDARFVEVLKSAGSRIKSASNEAKRLAKRKIRNETSTKVHEIKVKGASNGNKKVKVYEPKYRDTNNIIFIRDELESGGSAASDDPIFVRALEDLDARKLKHKDPNRQVFKVVNENDPQQNFNVENDIQIMKLDDETGISETYQNINGADVLKIETTPTNKNLENLSVDIKPTLDVATSPRHLLSPGPDQQRTLSELELFRQKHNLPEDGEFYTAIGPDGKEMILRRYINEESPDLSANRPGFLNVAMNHLKEKTNRPRHSKRRQLPAPSLDGYEESGRTSSEDEGVYSLKPPYPNQGGGGGGRHSGPPSVTSAPDILVRNDPEDITPKHYIRSPIIEETESNVEAELRSRDRARNSLRYKFWNNDPDVSLRFKIQDGRNSPEPAYTETKASILRRRNTLAKLRQKDAESGTNTGSYGRLGTNRHHWSLTDLTQEIPEEDNTTAYIRRWNSLSNDELVKFREPTIKVKRNNSNFLPKSSNMVQMANITVYPKSEIEPRKFSKYNPPRKRRSRNTSEELIYIRQNYPPDGRHTLWSRQAIPRNIEIQHISSNPSIAHVNSFGQTPSAPAPSLPAADSIIVSNTSSAASSRASSMLNIRKNDLGVVVEENNPLNQNSNNTNNKVLIDEKERENSKSSLLPATEAAKVAGGNVSPRKSDITPRYMNWYSKSKSNTVGQPLIMDAKQLIQRKENRSQSVPQDDEIERYLSKDEDAESGISSLSLTGSKKDSVLQKKSIFTIAYDNMAKKDIDFKFADENSQVED